VLDEALKNSFLATSKVLRFRVNDYILQNLIDGDCDPCDPMFQLLFHQAGMLPNATHGHSTVPWMEEPWKK
jgi:hypothetical protein